MSAYLTRIAQFTEALLLNRAVPGESAVSATESSSQKCLPAHVGSPSANSPSLDRQAFTIDFERLRRLCYNGGIPDIPGFRPLCWKLLLNFLPSDKSLWHETLERKRKAYGEFVADLWPPPGSNAACLTDSGFQDPISDAQSVQSMPDEDAARDRDLIISIERDVQRTSSSMSFYRLAVSEEIFVLNGLPPPKWTCPTLSPCTSRASSPAPESGKAKSPSGNQVDDEEEQVPPLRHYDVLRRILYIYAKLNPGIGYIQGMNHLVFPIYYMLATGGSFSHKNTTLSNSTLQSNANVDNVVKNEHVDDSILFAESDTFYLLHEVLTEYRDFFMNSMDNNKATGINSALESLAVRLQELDKPLADDLNAKGIPPTYYAFRWFTCLCAKELELPDILRLWDTLFADRIAARKRGRRELLKREREEISIKCDQNAQENLLVSGGSSESGTKASKTARHIRRYSLSSILHDIANSGPPPTDLDPTPRPGLFLTDFLATVVISRRPEIFERAFDESLEILQQNPWSLPVDELLRRTHQSHVATVTPKLSGRFNSGILSGWSSRPTFLRSSSPQPKSLNASEKSGNEYTPEPSQGRTMSHSRTQSDDKGTPSKAANVDFFSRFRMRAFTKAADAPQFVEPEIINRQEANDDDETSATHKDLDLSLWEKISSSITSKNY